MSLLNHGIAYWKDFSRSNARPKSRRGNALQSHQCRIDELEIRLVLSGDAGIAVGFDATADIVPVEIGPQTSAGSTVQIVGRYLFYNNSYFDGKNPGADAADDAAVDSSKSPLLPGGAATFANVSGYSRGINGLMVDMQNLSIVPAASDFTFSVGNSSTPANWPLYSGAAPTVSTRPGPSGSTRVTLIFPDGAIQQQWLRVTVNISTGLIAPDVFYFGSAIGDTGTGNSTQNFLVNSSDMLAERGNPATPFNRATVTNPYDINRDSLVNASDQLASRGNATNPFTALRVMTAPASPLNPIDFGAVGDGVTDDQAALTATLSQAKLQGRAVYIPATTFAHSDMLNVDSIEVYGAGDASILKALNPLKSAINLQGASPNLHHLKLTTDTTGVARQSSPDTTMVCIRAATGFTVDHITVQGGSSAGIMDQGGQGTATNYARITNNSVTATLADGIHNTHGARYILIDGNHVTNTGDDLIAVVSYQSDGVVCQDMLIQNNDVSGNSWGRGITVSGGTNVTIQNNTISHSEAAGILIASESSWSSMAVSGIKVLNNKIDYADFSGRTGHPGILLTGQPGFLVQDVQISGNTITNSTLWGIRIDANVDLVDITNTAVQIINGVAIRVNAAATRITQSGTTVS